MPKSDDTLFYLFGHCVTWRRLIGLMSGVLVMVLVIAVGVYRFREVAAMVA